MNALEKAAALHAEHHHTKYDWREVYAWMLPDKPTFRAGWDADKQAKLDEALKIVENWR